MLCFPPPTLIGVKERFELPSPYFRVCMINVCMYVGVQERFELPSPYFRVCMINVCMYVGVQEREV